MLSQSETKESKICDNLKHYPPFNPPHLVRISRYRHENCLAYALNHRLAGPDFYSYRSREFEDKDFAIKQVASEINSHFKNKDLIIPAANVKGVIPPVKENYYLIAFMLSYENDSLNQRYDYHFLVQNNDGLFSHRRGQAKPEKLDSNNKLIHDPRENTFYYTEDRGSITKKDGTKIPLNYRYEFIGFLYTLNLEKRAQPEVTNEIKKTCPPSDIKWERIGNFIPIIYASSTIALDRKVGYETNYKKSKIREINFLGYIRNTFRINVVFGSLDYCNEFLNTCPKELIESNALWFSEKNIYFDPASQKEFDLFFQLMHKFFALDETNLRELPRLLGIPEFKDNSLAALPDYPDFDPDFKNYPDSFSTENCLSYALCVRNGIDQFNNKFGTFDCKKGSEIEFAVSCLNSEFKDNQFALTAPNEPGELPQVKIGYYLIAMLFYKDIDYHFLVQNSDGYFSHRRGQGNLPERVDSENKPIINPETSKFVYARKNSYIETKMCYQFMGYIHVKTVPERRKAKFPMHIHNMLMEIEKPSSNNEYQEQYKQFRQKYVIYPPLIQYFEDARKEVTQFYKSNITFFSRSNASSGSSQNQSNQALSKACLKESSCLLL